MKWKLNGQRTCCKIFIRQLLLSYLVIGGCNAFQVSIPFQKIPQKISSRKTTILDSTNDADSNDTGTLSLFSPCKINLFLRILRKRPDNYHDLASLFQTVGFGDKLDLRRLPEGATADSFECNMEGVPTDGTNLVLRALDLIRNKTGITDQFFNAKLVKKVPPQAGLGGGSGNAATAMYGANELLGRPASIDQLIEWSAELGSDITFFLSRGTAYCTGRGEILTPAELPATDYDPSQTRVCLVKPSAEGLSTPKVFGELDYEELSTADPEELLRTFVEGGVGGAPSTSYVNDLEAPAYRVLPSLGELKSALESSGCFRTVLMSGSGSSLFGIGAADQKFRDAFGPECRPDLMVLETSFVRRPEDGWYQEPQ